MNIARSLESANAGADTGDIGVCAAMVGAVRECGQGDTRSTLTSIEHHESQRYQSASIPSVDDEHLLIDPAETSLEV